MYLYDFSFLFDTVIIPLFFFFSLFWMCFHWFPYHSLSYSCSFWIVVIHHSTLRHRLSDAPKDSMLVTHWPLYTLYTQVSGATCMLTLVLSLSMRSEKPAAHSRLDDPTNRRWYFIHNCFMNQCPELDSSFLSPSLFFLLFILCVYVT